MNYRILLITLFSLSTLFAQSGGTIQGKITDSETGEAIIGANVIVEGTTSGAATDIEGRFVISGLPVGNYQLRVDYIGYASRMITDLVVKASRPTMVDVELQQSLIELEAAVVVAEYFSKNQDTPTSTQVQSQEEIRRLPGGFEDVIRAVSILPGVAQADGGRNDLIVRGGAPSENLYLVEGIEIPNINHFGTQGASGGPQSYINLDFVDETSFSTGGFSVKYGDKLSSILDISLREGLSDQLATKATISASQFGLNLEGPLTGNGNFLFSARRSYLDFLFKAAGFGFVPEYWDFLTKATYNLNATDQITFLGIAALDNVKWFNETLEQRNDNSRILGSDQKQYVFGVNYRHVMSKGLLSTNLSQVRVSYDFLQRDASLAPIFQNASTDINTALKSDVTWRLNKNIRLSSGLKLSRVDFSSDLFLKQDDIPGVGTLNIDSELKETGYVTGGYAQLSYRQFRFNTTLGVRADHSSFLEAAPVVSPRISMNYNLTGEVTITGSLGRYNQYPSTVWLVSNPVNRQLDPIKADQLVLGMEYLWRSDTKIRVEGYNKWYHNYPVSQTRPYLVMVNTGAGFGGSDEGFASFGVDPLSNEGSGWARGMELFVQKKMSEVPAYGTASMSYNQSMFTALDGIERPGSFDQTWIMNVGGGYVFNEKWELSTKFRYATGKPYTPLDNSGNQMVDQYNGLRLSANHNLDVRLDRRWTNNGWDLVTYIDIQNVYNRQASSTPVFDRNTGELVENQGLGILPTIGITAEI